MTTNPCMQTTISQALKGGIPGGATSPYRIKKAVLGEICTFIELENYVHRRDVELAQNNNIQSKQLMQGFIAQPPEQWNEDIGE